MDHKVLGWIQIIGGILALLPSGRIGYSGMMGMMGYGSYNLISSSGGVAATILALLFIISGVHYVTHKNKK